MAFLTSDPAFRTLRSGKEEDMLDDKLLEILACPKCKGELDYDRENDRLTCQTCRLRYEVKDDIPIMLIEEAESF
jgi:uncharacterized protein YbaR (Trm112 family)